MVSRANQTGTKKDIISELHSYVSRVFPLNSSISKEEKYKSYVLLYTILFGNVLLLILILFNSFMHFNTTGIFGPALLLGGLYLLLMKVKVKLLYIGNTIALGFFVLMAFDATTSGGIFYLGVFWTIIVPTVAFCFAGFRSGVFWTVVIMIYALVLYYIEVNNTTSSLEIVLQTPEFYLIGTVGLFLYLSMMLAVFKRGNDLIIEELKEQKRLLKAEQQKTYEKSELLQEAQDSLIEKNKILEEAKLLLLKKNEELQEFAYATSHDLKSPLRTVMSFSQLLNRHLTQNYLIDEKAKKYLELISSGSNNMNTFINDLLEYASLGVGVDSFVSTDLNKVIHDVEESLSESINSSRSTIIYSQLPILEVVPIKINQLFQNLISNAIKFRKEEELLELKISAKELPLYWQFTFEDNGIGIKDEDLKKIFEPFKKLHSREKFSGSGIGLSTCQKIIEIHQGKIWVTSKLGSGTIFYFTLPKRVKGNKITNV